MTPAALALSEWTVVYTNVRHGSTFEVRFRAASEAIARRAGDQALAQKLRHTVGQMNDWTHLRTTPSAA